MDTTQSEKGEQKGTLADFLVKEKGLEHIEHAYIFPNSIGEILRDGNDIYGVVENRTRREIHLDVEKIPNAKTVYGSDCKVLENGTVRVNATYNSVPEYRKSCEEIGIRAEKAKQWMDEFFESKCNVGATDGSYDDRLLSLI